MSWNYTEEFLIEDFVEAMLYSRRDEPRTVELLVDPRPWRAVVHRKELERKKYSGKVPKPIFLKPLS